MALALALAVLVPCSTLAQPGRSVTEADIEKARKSQPKITEQDIEQARRRHAAPFGGGPEPGSAPSTPRLDALPQPSTRATPDLGAIAEGFKPGMQQAGPGAELSDGGPALLIFISFAIPDATLNRLVDQAAAAGATLVLRGMVDGSLRTTAARIQQLLGKRQVAVQIDPRAFDRYAVEVTPTFVLARSQVDASVAAPAPEVPCAAGQCAPGDTFVSMAGDVSLDFALNHFAHAAPAFKKKSAVFMERLRAAAQRQGRGR